MKKESIIPLPTELFTTLSLQKIGNGKSGELKPILAVLEHQDPLPKTELELKTIILNRRLIDSIKYN